jgi:hypothetical protein
VHHPDFIFNAVSNHLPASVIGDAEIVVPDAGHTEPLDEARLEEEPRYAADGAFAGKQGRCQLVRGLVGWVGDEQPAEDSARHPRQASFLESYARFLNELHFFHPDLILHHCLYQSSPTKRRV